MMFFVKVQNQGISKDTLKVNNIKPEIFSSGFIDVMNNGQVNV